MRPKKTDYTFLRHHPHHLHPTRIKNFDCLSNFWIEKSYLYHELSVAAILFLDCLLRKLENFTQKMLELTLIHCFYKHFINRKIVKK